MVAMEQFQIDLVAQQVKRSMGRAYALLQRGNAAGANALCDQVLEKDNSAAGPLIIKMMHARNVGQWETSVQLGLAAARTRPEFESGAFDIGFGVTYDDLADWLQDSCTQYLADNRGQDLDAPPPADISLGLGLAAHAKREFDEARRNYQAVLHVPGNMGRLGQVINLLHALEHQAGRPEEASKWLDLSMFPIAGHFDEVDGVSVEQGFNDGLCEEILESSKLLPWNDNQSRNWYVAQDFEDQANNVHIKTLRRLFLRILEMNDSKFRGLAHDFTHPNFQSFPADYVVKIFSAVLKGAGHVGPHVHSNAFLVGNYYAAVPDEPESAEKAGVVYGKHLYTAMTGADYPTRTFIPTVGTMLMWPAYYSHATVPSQAGETRIAVGFDLEPAPE